MYLYLRQKEKLLIRYDSVYSAFLQKANLRLADGESNVLEKAIAENQKGTIGVQLKQVQQQIHLVALEFVFVLNAPEAYVPAETEIKSAVELSTDPALPNDTAA